MSTVKQVLLFSLLLTGATLILGAWTTLYRLWVFFALITGV